LWMKTFAYCSACCLFIEGECTQFRKIWRKSKSRTTFQHRLYLAEHRWVWSRYCWRNASCACCTPRGRLSGAESHRKISLDRRWPFPADIRELKTTCISIAADFFLLCWAYFIH
jgi:hypothetical protein